MDHPTQDLRTIANAEQGRAGLTAHVRVIGATLDDDQCAYITRKLGMKLGKFAASIERVSVRVTDVNGPRGGLDQRCRVKVVLRGLPTVLIDRQDANKEVAIDAALRAAEESVRRAVGRRRMKPLHRRPSRAFQPAA